MSLKTDRWGYESTSASAEWAVPIAGAPVLAISSTLTWVDGTAGSLHGSRTLLEIPVGAVALAAAIVLIVSGALATLFGRAEGTALASTVATAVAILAALAVVLGELSTAFLPTGRIPVTAQRLALGTGAGAGAWLALVAALAIVIATIEPLRRRFVTALAVLWSRGALAVGSGVALTMAAILLVRLRQEAWLATPALGGHFSISAQVLPCVAPITFAAVGLALAGVALVLLGRFELGALTAASAGWLASACAAFVAVLPTAFVDTPLAVQATATLWLSYAFGFGVAVVAAGLLWSGRV